jgi:hypothetical protein
MENNSKEEEEKEKNNENEIKDENKDISITNEGNSNNSEIEKNNHSINNITNDNIKNIETIITINEIPNNPWAPSRLSLQMNPNPIILGRQPSPKHYHDIKSLIKLSFSALGVVFGDIGTSPLYTYDSIFPDAPPSEELIKGALSLIMWSLIIIVSLKYSILVLRADYKGKGGAFALVSQLLPYFEKREILAVVLCLGASLLLADGTITPAISVLSAVEGLEIANSNLQVAVIPISIVIIFLLFFFSKIRNWESWIYFCTCYVFMVCFHFLYWNISYCSKSSNF